MPGRKSPPPVEQPPARRFLTIDQTAKRLGIGRQTIGFYVLEGKLPAVNIAGAASRAVHRIPADAAPARDACEQPLITRTPPPQVGEDVPPMLRCEDIAERLACSAEHVAGLIETGRLPAMDVSMSPGKTRAAWRITIPDYERFVASCQV